MPGYSLDFGVVKVMLLVGDVLDGQSTSDGDAREVSWTR
jgi:hypothetical protein